jgi:hypothetical protein
MSRASARGESVEAVRRNHVSRCSINRFGGRASADRLAQGCARLESLLGAEAACAVQLGTACRIEQAVVRPSKLSNEVVASQRDIVATVTCSAQVAEGFSRGRTSRGAATSVEASGRACASADELLNGFRRQSESVGGALSSGSQSQRSERAQGRAFRRQAR